MRILLVISILFLLASCRKTKLKDEYSIFEGKWKWVSAQEIRTNLSNGSSTYSYYYDSDYPDAYFVEFDRKGKVKFYTNETLDLEYRIVIQNFSPGCNEFPGCALFGLRLDNDKEKSIGGFVGYDTLLSSSQHTNLPLIYHYDDNFSYDYWHKFVKVN